MAKFQLPGSHYQVSPTSGRDGYQVSVGFLGFSVDGVKAVYPSPDPVVQAIRATLELKEYSATFTLDLTYYLRRGFGVLPHPWLSPLQPGATVATVAGGWSAKVDRVRAGAISYAQAMEETLAEFEKPGNHLAFRRGAAASPPGLPPQRAPQPPQHAGGGAAAAAAAPAAAAPPPPPAGPRPPPAPAAWPELEHLPLISLQQLVDKPELQRAFVASQVAPLRDFLRAEEAELAAVEEAQRDAAAAEAEAAEAMRRMVAAEAEAEAAVAAAGEAHAEVEAVAAKFSVDRLKLALNTEVAALEDETRRKKAALLAPEGKLSEAEVADFLEKRRRLHFAKLLLKAPEK